MSSFKEKDVGKKEHGKHRLGMAQQNDSDDTDWENFNVRFGDYSKYDCLLELAENLKTLATMVKKQEPIPELRFQLDKVFNIESQSVKSLVDLENTKELVKKRELESDDEKTILNEILNTRKIVSKEIVEEGKKCSLSISYAQFVNLYRAWKVIKDANFVNPKLHKQIDEIDGIIQKTIAVCRSTKVLMEKYGNVDSVWKALILDQLEEKRTLICGGYQDCLKLIALIGEIRMQVGEKILNLIFVEFEQGEAYKLNSKRVKKKISFKMLINQILVVKPLILGIATGGNYLAANQAEDARNKLIEIKDKLAELENLLKEIEETKNETEKFLQQN